MPHKDPETEVLQNFASQMENVAQMADEIGYNDGATEARALAEQFVRLADDRGRDAV